MSDKKNPLDLVREYRELVLLYEALDEQIDKLIMANGGGTENMSEDDLSQYRNLAHKRSEVRNDMRILEQQLQMNDEDD